MQPLVENTVNTPAFLGKLWKMVNDPTTDHLISWSPAGNSFIIQNQAQFWYELLPLYYKHNNMSSFVRQLNMYGFHKMSTVENGTMDADKDEIQFTHPFFQRDQPELLKNIKRKATASKTSLEGATKHDELTKVLTDVKHLRGRQANVDSQLNAMKQENALLWREVAILRQKHLKQQKIVNKLIQFLVTLVQPSRMTVGVKRGYHLMLHESPNKKTKIDLNKNSNNIEGPTIHELDSELDLPSNLYEEDTPLIDSPGASSQTEINSPLSSALLAEGEGENSGQSSEWVKQELGGAEGNNLIDNSEITDENFINALEPNFDTSAVADDKIFLNPTTQDTLLSNLIKNNYDENNKNREKKNPNCEKNELPNKSTADSNMAVATRVSTFYDIIKSIPSTSDCYAEDLTNHIETTQNELEQFKDILNGYNPYVDANALLGELKKARLDFTEGYELNKLPVNYKDANLFSGDSPPVYDLTTNEERNDTLIESGDPLVSGSELTPYGNNFDFTELFDDSIDTEVTSKSIPAEVESPSTLNTPIIKDETQPTFPIVSPKEKKL